MSREERKPPYLESECKMFLYKAYENLDNVMAKIQTLYNSDDCKFELPNIKHLLEWATVYINQVQTYNKFLAYYERQRKAKN